jgi:hypothetical protein
VLAKAEQYLGTLGQANGGTGYVAPEVKARLREQMHDLRAVREVITRGLQNNQKAPSMTETGRFTSSRPYEHYPPPHMSRDKFHLAATGRETNKQEADAALANLERDAAGFIVWSNSYRLRDVMRTLRLMHPDKVVVTRSGTIETAISERGVRLFTQVAYTLELERELRLHGLRHAKEPDYKERRASQMEYAADRPD